MSGEKIIDTTTGHAAIPFLRWTGSKKWLVAFGIEKYFPKQFNNYHEPFLGGGAIFFHLQPRKQVFLCDLNEELINTYVQLRDDVESVISHLKTLSNSEEEYYRIRAMKCRSNYTRAARFIYLNRTSFNGIYRVNPDGNYNVPYGHRPRVDVVTPINLRLVSKALSGVHIAHDDFESIIDRVQPNDLVYLDPPYTVAHENNGFIEYNSKLFSWEDQERLARTVEKIKNKKAFFVLSNAEHISIRKLYKGTGKILALSRPSIVGGRNKTRGIFNEVLITNVNK